MDPYSNKFDKFILFYLKYVNIFLIIYSFLYKKGQAAVGARNALAGRCGGGGIDGEVKCAGEVRLDGGIYGKWPSGHGQLTDIRLSDGCGEYSVLSTVVRGYDLRKPGGHLGIVGLASGVGNFREGKT